MEGAGEKALEKKEAGSEVELVGARVVAARAAVGTAVGRVADLGLVLRQQGRLHHLHHGLGMLRLLTQGSHVIR